ncbi:MAG: pyrroline-5-carboxylate reductase [Spirochaetales bacterium]|nr:pyrroline-5-carboxylate reductase [Spirochaetales bacterium]
MKTIGIIGFGNMGSALYKGLVSAKQSCHVLVAECNEKKIQTAGKQYNLRIVANKELVTAADIVIIAVKPQELAELISEIKTVTKGKRIISVVAGKRIDFFIKQLATDQVVRFMPNLAAVKGLAAVGMSSGSKVSNEFRKDCLEIAQAIGVPYTMPESLMPAVTGLSGSGIGYVFAFIHALALGGVHAGFKYDEAVAIALTTVEGAAAFLKDTGQNPIEALSKVISPAGTTIQGIKTLEELGFTHAVMDAVAAAAERAKDFEV